MLRNLNVKFKQNVFIFYLTQQTGNHFMHMNLQEAGPARPKVTVPVRGNVWSCGSTAQMSVHRTTVSKQTVTHMLVSQEVSVASTQHLPQRVSNFNRSK